MIVQVPADSSVTVETLTVHTAGVLDAKLTSRRVADRLDDKRFRGRSLAAVLLDQAFLSGVGNYIRCDALFLAGMHPLRKAADYGQIGRAHV